MTSAISPGFLETLGANVLRGRTLGSEDAEGAEAAALVTQAFAARFMPDQEPIGPRLRVTMWGDSIGTWRRTVGVVPDLRCGELAGEDGREVIFIPLAQSQQRWLYVLGRAHGSTADAIAAVRTAISATDPDLPILYQGSLRQAIARGTWFIGLFGGAFVIFGVAALVLAMVGLYGVLAFWVAQRTREIRVHMAIGATPWRIHRLVPRQGMLQVISGLGGGLLLAAGLTQFLAIILFGIDNRDPIVFGGVVRVCWSRP